MNFAPNADESLDTIGRQLGLGNVEQIIPGYEGRSHVGVYADTVVKIYLFRPEIKKPREVAALGRWLDTGLVPRLLHHSGESDQVRWVHMTRIAGVNLDDVPVADRTPKLARRMGEALARLHAVPVEGSVDMPTDQCRPVHAHGDFASRNALGRPQMAEVTGLIDFEKGQPACFAWDLTSYLMRCRMGDEAYWDDLLAGYGANVGDVSICHLEPHIVKFRDWALAWATRINPTFAAKVRAAAAALLP